MCENVPASVFSCDDSIKRRQHRVNDELYECEVPSELESLYFEDEFLFSTIVEKNRKGQVSSKAEKSFDYFDFVFRRL